MATATDVPSFTVPADPTPEMIAAGWAIVRSEEFSRTLRFKLDAQGLGVIEIFKAMVAAAPQEES